MTEHNYLKFFVGRIVTLFFYCHSHNNPTSQQAEGFSTINITFILLMWIAVIHMLILLKMLIFLFWIKPLISTMSGI